MTNRLFVGNLPWKVTEDPLKEHFETIGKVFAVKIIKDRQSGRSRGFGFVDMNNIKEAMDQLDGKFLQGRPLTIKEAVRKEKDEDNLHGPGRGTSEQKDEV